MLAELLAAGKDLHHAYLLVGSRQQILVELKPHLPPDWIYQEADNFGINDARYLRRWQQQTASEGRRCFVLSFAAMTVEAQNALLKTLEEPVLGKHFFLITASAKNILPTLLSRLQVQKLGLLSDAPDKHLSELVSRFSVADHESRLQLIADYLAQSGSTSGAVAKAAALDLVGALELHLHKHWQKDLANQRLVVALRQLTSARDYLQDQAALPKMILEHLALFLPML
ncbi:MAG: hypothetical protein U9M92_00120 [Patescibacteria group bacterium]|nr:hypothetical protein [Patescibacteria group bacterium]